ncbi:MAG TPA: hypothetical protein VFW62_11675 [bacterium]|nr:hypothetical protein [bacterium]
MFRIPVDSAQPSYRLRLEIEDRTYIFRFYFNERSNRWIMSIYDDQEQQIVVGMALNVNFALLGQYADQRLPPGEIILFDTSEKNQECGRDDLGNRCVLLYDDAA